ncbi:MAG: hypothetical protein JWM23_761 [Microbacteriaceae bacterium]|jgi:hypothetical protein|nr:hypothetical protein [Microbacteriaceae bacterium]
MTTAVDGGSIPPISTIGPVTRCCLRIPTTGCFRIPTTANACWLKLVLQKPWLGRCPKPTVTFGVRGHHVQRRSGNVIQNGRMFGRQLRRSLSEINLDELSMALTNWEGGLYDPLTSDVYMLGGGDVLGVDDPDLDPDKAAGSTLTATILGPDTATWRTSRTGSAVPSN